jgi:hypothetical protein
MGLAKQEIWLQLYSKHTERWEANMRFAQNSFVAIVVAAGLWATSAMPQVIDLGK